MSQFKKILQHVHTKKCNFQNRSTEGITVIAELIKRQTIDANEKVTDVNELKQIRICDHFGRDGSSAGLSCQHSNVMMYVTATTWDDATNVVVCVKALPSLSANVPHLFLASLLIPCIVRVDSTFISARLWFLFLPFALRASTTGPLSKITTKLCRFRDFYRDAVPSTFDRHHSNNCVPLKCRTRASSRHQPPIQVATSPFLHHLKLQLMFRFFNRLAHSITLGFFSFAYDNPLRHMFSLSVQRSAFAYPLVQLLQEPHCLSMPSLLILIVFRLPVPPSTLMKALECASHSSHSTLV